MKKALGLSAALVLAFGLATNWRDLPLGALQMPTASQPEQNEPIAPTPETSTASEWQTTPIKVIKEKTNGKIALSGDGQRLIVISDSNRESDTLAMYNALTGEWMSETISNEFSFSMVALNHTGDRVAAITEELSTGRIQLSLLSQYLDTTYWQKTLSQNSLKKDASTGNSLMTTAFTALDFRPGDDMILTGLISAQVPAEKSSDVGAFDSQISLHSAETGELMRSLKTAPNLITSLHRYAFSPDGNFLAALGETWPEGDLSSLNDRGKTTLNVWQIDNERPRLPLNRDQNVFKTLDVSDQSVEIAASSDGKVNVLSSQSPSSSFYNPSENNSLNIWDIQTGEKIASQQVAPSGSTAPRQIHLSTDGETALLVGKVGTTTQIKNLQTGQQWTLEMDSSIDSYTNAVFSKNGDYLAITTSENILIFGKR
jgi:hypothetical protein